MVWVETIEGNREVRSVKYLQAMYLLTHRRLDANNRKDWRQFGALPCGANFICQATAILIIPAGNIEPHKSA